MLPQANGWELFLTVCWGFLSQKCTTKTLQFKEHFLFVCLWTKSQKLLCWTHVPWQNKYLSIACSRAACIAVLQRELPPRSLNRFVVRITPHAHFCSFGLLIFCHQLIWNQLEVKTPFLLQFSTRTDSNPLPSQPCGIWEVLCWSDSQVGVLLDWGHHQ